MNFILDDKKYIKLLMNGIQSSLLVGSYCILGMTNQGLFLLQNAENFEQLVCLRDQCHIILFNEDMFGLIQAGVPLTCFIANGQQDKLAISKNIKLTECFVEINLNMLNKPLRSLEYNMKKMQIQLGYKVQTEQYSKKVALQLCINCFMTDGSIYEQVINVKEVSQTNQILYVYKNALELMEQIPANQTQFQVTKENKLLLLSFDHKIGQEMKLFNQDEGLDLQLDKEYVKLKDQSDLTFSSNQFIDYKFTKICEAYGWIQHLLIDPNFINPVQYLMNKHDLNGQLLLNRKRQEKMGTIYFCTQYQNYMFSMSTSASVINLYDENATELDIDELMQVIEQNNKMPQSQQETNSNSKIMINFQDSEPKKIINYGPQQLDIQSKQCLVQTDIHSKYLQFAEEQSRSYAPKSMEEIRLARERLFNKPKEESKINKNIY